MKEVRDIKIDQLMGNQNPIVDLFCKITSGIEIINCNVYNEEGLEFIYHKDSQWIFYQDAKNGKFWAHYKRYWEILKSEFGLEYEEIQAITKLLVEEALKREVTTPSRYFYAEGYEVEEALKREVTTPKWVFGDGNTSEVEEALKREVGTPTNIWNKYKDEVEEALKREVGTPGNRTKSFPVEEALKKKQSRSIVNI